MGKPATDKTEVVDVDIVEVDKPVGRPAVKKIPQPEKEKAPETKATLRQKALRLNAKTEATERKEQAVWLDPEDMGARIPKEYCGQGRCCFISMKLSYLGGHVLSYGAPSPAFDPLVLRIDFRRHHASVGLKYVWSLKIKEVLSVVAHLAGFRSRSRNPMHLKQPGRVCRGR